MNSAVKNAKKWLNDHHLLEQFDVTYQQNKLTMINLHEPKTKGICVDFTSNEMIHRRKFGGGRGEAIAKAVGINRDSLPSVLDATAGLGTDGFVLAAIGCHVTLVERHPVVYALLLDGIERAYLDEEMGNYFHDHLRLLHFNSYLALDENKLTPNSFDVVYLDPMFPHRTKTALVKKEMRWFQTLVGNDEDANHLIDMAMAIAKKRVVVKRPLRADYLGNKKTDNAIITKNHRFDLYRPYD